MLGLRMTKWMLFLVLPIGGIVTTAAVLAGVVVLLVFVGGPNTDPVCGGRDVVVSSELAASFDARWDAFSSALDAGRAATLSLDESVITARARTFLSEHGVDEVRNVVVFFFAADGGYGEARAEVDVPVLGGTAGRIRGRLDLRGASPVLEITKLDVGSLPGFVEGPITNAIEDAINNEALADLSLEHRLTLTFGEGTVLISGEP